MRKKKHNKSSNHTSDGFEQLPASSEFYAGSPTEQPLYQDKPRSEFHRVRKTGRHQAVGVRGKDRIDPRERSALRGILKSVVIIILLLIAFFLLWKGIKLYEESVWIETQSELKSSPVLQEVMLIEEFDIETQDSRELFADRVEIWKEASRLVRSADGLLVRNNYDQAIKRCQDALRLDPSHMGALERLGNLYYEKGMNIESINSYIRLLSIDPSRAELQKKLIQVLDAHQDANAVVYVSHWYLEENEYDSDVQRYLAHALFQQEKYADGINAYNRALKDNPRDTPILERLAQAQMILEQYEDALVTLEKLSESNYRDQGYYRQIAVCNAQLGNSMETVQTLGKAAHLFGQNVVMGWVQDPRLDPVREDRTFQDFADRVGGEEFRKWLEKVAKTMDGDDRKDISPQLTLPDSGRMDSELLKPRK